MARKFNEENERVKRRYLHFLREAKRSDMATVDKAADAILRFERSTKYKPFKRFHIEQAVAFKRHLSNEKNARTGAPLSKATVDSALRMVKAFILWLAGQPGYKSRIAYADAEYFNLNAKDARIAHTARDAIYPSPEQCRHAFGQMPSATPLQRRDKALFCLSDAHRGTRWGGCVHAPQACRSGGMLRLSGRPRREDQIRQELHHMVFPGR